MRKEHIAANLEVAFSRYGFAEPSVTQLKEACEVSLRTLYKYYPSKDAMIVAALQFRHQRYLDFLLLDAPAIGIAAVQHIFNRLEQWMQDFAPNGCLSMNAMAAYPDNHIITDAVTTHKEDVRHFLGQQSGREDLSTALFLLHEGVSSAWPVRGHEAIDTAHRLLSKLITEEPQRQ